MRVPQTHEHTCAICNAIYLSHTSIYFGTCHNCNDRAKKYVIEGTYDTDPKEVWTKNTYGELELDENLLHDLYADLLRMFENKFGRNPGIISDHCQDELYEIINNNVPRP